MCLFRLFQSCHRHYESKSIFLRNRWEKTLQCMFICIYHYRLYIVYCKNCWKKTDKERGYKNCRGKSLHDQSQLEMFSSNIFIKPNTTSCWGDTVDPSVSQSIFQSSFFPFFIFIFFKRSAQRLLIKPLHRTQFQKLCRYNKDTMQRCTYNQKIPIP